MKRQINPIAAIIVIVVVLAIAAAVLYIFPARIAPARHLPGELPPPGGPPPPM